MFTLQQTTRFEQSVKKSRFLATALPVESEEDAKRQIAAHSTADANHNCWAWRIGQSYRFSDDGEPGGTAGKPILAAIEGQLVDRVAVIVTRWFGGVLLGTGGLVRAYGGTAASCLRAAELVPLTVTIAGKVELLFSDLALVKARLAGFSGVQITGEQFTGSGATLTAQFPEAAFDELSRLVADLTSGRAAIQPIEQTPI
jgi:uncharacterized YigZ family protein